MKELFLGRGYPETVVINQIDQVVFGRDQSVKINLASGIPFSYYPITPMLKSSVKLLGTYFLFCAVIEKFKRFSHLLRSYLTELQEK